MPAGIACVTFFSVCTTVMYVFETPAFCNSMLLFMSEKR